MSKHERVAIMGCGSGGGYLYRLLRQRDPKQQLTLFDYPSSNACGIKGCAWGLSRPLFSQLCVEAGMNPEKYFIGRYDHVMINGQHMKADLAIINKPVLARDLVSGAVIKNPQLFEVDEYDRVIDATGSDRVFLPNTDATPVVSAVQIRLKTKGPKLPTAIFNPHGGYSWMFPIGENEIHLGSLSPGGFGIAMEELNMMLADSRSERICSCRGEIRCHGPVLPFVHGKVWGIGESIGLVDPITGAGIIPAMTSAKLLVENWNSPDGYQASLLQRYSYMIKEASVLKRLMAGNPLSSGDLFFPKQALETIGIKPSFFELMALVLKGAKDYLSHNPKQSAKKPC